MTTFKRADQVQEREVMQDKERDLIVDRIEWDRDRHGTVTHVVFTVRDTSQNIEKMRFAANQSVPMTITHV